MSTMISEVYDAAGSPDDKARKAAEAIASYDNRFNQIDRDLFLLKWMVGAILAGIVSLVLRTFFRKNISNLAEKRTLKPAIKSLRFSDI